MSQRLELNPISLHSLQKVCREMVKSMQVAAYDSANISKSHLGLQKLLLSPSGWELLRRWVPELDVRDNQISSEDNSLANFQRQLQAKNLLRPALVLTDLNDVHARHREYILDVGFSILPQDLFEAWHNLVDEEFGVQTPFIMVKMRSENNEHDTVRQHQLLAYHDRVYRNICAWWRWDQGPSDDLTPAFIRFQQAYHIYRSKLFACRDEQSA